MKIGIISINMYSKGLNFACPLHTYAFQQFLLKNGIESTVINYKPIYYKNFDLKHPYDFYSKRYAVIESGIPKTPEEEKINQEKLEYLREKCEAWKPLYKEREIRYEKFQNFIEKNYIKTKACYDSDLLEVMDPGFDCYICATDVIWKSEPGFGYDRGFFLGSSCMENKWKIAYAGSCNTRKGETEEEERQFFKYMSDIDRISVREASLKEYIESKSDRQVTLVMDPVLLHEKEFYEKMTVKPQEEHYLLLYYVMEQAKDTLSQAVKYAKAHNLKIVELTERSEKEGRLQDYEDVETIYHYDIGVEEWLGYIQYADCVFTNSFHACCFCALFEKKFFAGKRFGDKIDSVLDKLGLSGRRIDAQSDLINHEPPEIDYAEVREKLSVWREESSEFILGAIHEMEGKQKEPKDYSVEKKNIKYNLLYNGGMKNGDFSGSYCGIAGTLEKTANGGTEFHPENARKRNDGTTTLMKNGFILPGYQFKGWKIRIKIDNKWFWYLNDGTLCPKAQYDKKKTMPVKIFEDEALIPYMPVNRIKIMVAVAVWEKVPEPGKSEQDQALVSAKETGLLSKIKKLLKKVL